MKFHKLSEPKKQKDGALYIKIGDGESIVLVPRGEIFGFKIKWQEGKAVEIPETNPSKFNRFKVNVIVSENGVYSARIWEFGILIYNQLAAYSEEMEITKTKIKISRKGIGKDTEWFLIPLGTAKFTELEKIEAVKLNILGSKVDSHSQHDSLIRNSPEPEEIPYFGDDPGVTEDDGPLPF